MSQKWVLGPSDPARTLSFTARRRDVRCDYIRVIYRSGSQSDVFSGELERGETQRIDLPGRLHYINRINFRCHSEHGRAAIRIGADLAIGWRPHQDDDYSGSGAYPPPGPGMWGGDSGGVRRPDAWHRWTMITSERFEGRHDRESSRPGWSGRHITQLALRPIDNDAVCTRLGVEFANGRQRMLDLSRYRRMERGLFYIVDLPGNARNVTKIWLRCRARGDYDVRVQVWGKRDG